MNSCGAISRKLNYFMYQTSYSDSTNNPNFPDGSTFTPDIALYCMSQFLAFYQIQIFLFMTIKLFFLKLTKKHYFGA